MKEVLRRLDKNGDKVLTKAEFVAGGADGLPSFEQYGKGVLGHHYGELDARNRGRRAHRTSASLTDL